MEIFLSDHQAKSNTVKPGLHKAQGVLPYQEVGEGGGGEGGLGTDIKFRGKICNWGAKFSQVHQIRGKIWEVLLPQDAKVGKESQFWGHLGLYLKFRGQNLGCLSPIILEAKFGALTGISEANFRAKPPLRPPYIKYPHGP